jgi:ABC-type phosphonate transport system ATPase subunit
MPKTARAILQMPPATVAAIEKLGADLAVARLLAQRMVVMQGGYAVESGLTDQVLDDPQHPYTQLLVSSVLPP